ncbi:hypothetical protein JW926_02160, partial [Candidatus Sumerlaeota bacterium]|nr:hypothetical protein [Candidatus Sumerlaeota bacterium]
MRNTNIKHFYQIPRLEEILFGKNVELLSSVDELFELDLAYLEFITLNEEELLERAAYFRSINQKLTRHFLMCNSNQKSHMIDRSNSTKIYFENGLFSTGYATHGLFPYRGKFHPQLIKSLINIIGIRKNENILDPMCGSGTTNIESSLMGINSYAIDLNPFCQFMTKVKYNSLFIDEKTLKGISDNANDIFNFFIEGNPFDKLKKIREEKKLRIYELSLLAFLDSLGYSKRVSSSTHQQLFVKVLKRYEDTVDNFLKYSKEHIEYLGKVNILSEATATQIPLDDNSIDGIITSPPYSFAIDYVKNDEDQLRYLGYNVDDIRKNMIGLKGKNKDQRLTNYFNDMDIVCSKAARVLKPGKYFVMIIGSNTNQTGGIRLEQSIIDSCRNHGLSLVKSILKPIKGMRNTMKDEYILFFQKGSS